MSSGKRADTKTLHCTEAEETKTPGRKRCLATRECILEATLELLAQTGFAALTIEGIAAEAGVGKTTIYRWWPGKAGLVMDAFLETVAPHIPFPDTGSLREDLRTQVRRFVKIMSGPYGRTIAVLIGGGQMDEELATAFRDKWVEARRQEARLVFNRARERGELRADIDLEAAMDMLYGAIYFRLLIGHQKLSPRFAEDIVDTLLDGISG